MKNTTFADLGLSSGNGSIRLLEQFTSSCIEAYTKEIEANPPKKALVDVTVVPVRSEKSTKPANYEKKSATVNQVILSPPQAAQPKELPQSTHYLNVDNPDERPDVAPDVKVYKPAPEGASPANSNNF